jgi:hypothetical protein
MHPVKKEDRETEKGAPDCTKEHAAGSADGIHDRVPTGRPSPKCTPTFRAKDERAEMKSGCGCWCSAFKGGR